ncbi:hypothetical protein V3481_010501 [Fusarium oxysporum f. sp. vasinfectum]
MELVSAFGVLDERDLRLRCIALPVCAAFGARQMQPPTKSVPIDGRSWFILTLGASQSLLSLVIPLLAHDQRGTFLKCIWAQHAALPSALICAWLSVDST